MGEKKAEKSATALDYLNKRFVYTVGGRPVPRSIFAFNKNKAAIGVLEYSLNQ